MSYDADILFVNRLFPSGFNPDSTPAEGLGGIELTTIQLAQLLTKKGMKVALINQTNQCSVTDGISTHPMKYLDKISAPVVVSSNDAIPLIKTANGNGAIYWMHNPLKIEKAIRRKQFFPLLKVRPHAIFVGKTLARRQRFFPYFRSRKTIGHGVADAFHNYGRDTPEPIVVWSSQPHRGLARILRLWMERIAPKVTNAKFLIFAKPPKNTHYSLEELSRRRVVFMPRISQQELAEHLRKARVMVYPGFEDETFCSAAAEAICSGVPVVTEGIGSLSERVQHGKTGIICKGDTALSNWAARLLTDDKLWKAMQPHCAEERNHLSWGNIAEQWINHINTIK